MSRPFHIVEGPCEVQDCPTGGTFDGHGRRYSVPADKVPAGFQDQGAERQADFLTNVPAPRAPRRAPRPKKAAPLAIIAEAAPETSAPG